MKKEVMTIKKWAALMVVILTLVLLGALFYESGTTTIELPEPSPSRQAMTIATHELNEQRRDQRGVIWEQLKKEGTFADNLRDIKVACASDPEIETQEEYKNDTDTIRFINQRQVKYIAELYAEPLVAKAKEQKLLGDDDTGYVWLKNRYKTVISSVCVGHYSVEYVSGE